MTAVTKAAAVSMLGMLIGAAIALGSPPPVAAEKLPVDCSGRVSECFKNTTCTEWVDHGCRERTTEYWYWYR